MHFLSCRPSSIYTFYRSSGSSWLWNLCSSHIYSLSYVGFLMANTIRSYLRPIIAEAASVSRFFAALISLVAIQRHFPFILSTAAVATEGFIVVLMTTIKSATYNQISPCTWDQFQTDLAREEWYREEEYILYGVTPKITTNHIEDFSVLPKNHNCCDVQLIYIREKCILFI